MISDTFAQDLCPTVAKFLLKIKFLVVTASVPQADTLENALFRSSFFSVR